MHEIVFSYNPYQEGLTTADAKGLMVVLKGVSFGTVLFLLCALRSLLFKAFCSEKHQFLISANHFWQGLEAEVGIGLTTRFPTDSLNRKWNWVHSGLDSRAVKSRRVCAGFFPS